MNTMSPIEIIAVHDPKQGYWMAFLRNFPGVVIQVNKREDIELEMHTAFGEYIAMLGRKRAAGFQVIEQTIT